MTVKEEKLLLVTAFEPFGGEAVNASLLALRALPETVGPWRLVKRILPVVFGGAGKEAIRAAEELRPDAVLCLGQAAGRKAVTPELVAVNLQYARIPDNAGNAPMDEPVVRGGREAYFATLPARKLARAMTDAGFPASLSCSAGLYVCNDLMYRMLHRLDGTGVPMDFIHVPAAADLDPAVSAKAVEAAICALG